MDDAASAHSYNWYPTSLCDLIKLTHITKIHCIHACIALHSTFARYSQPTHHHHVVDPSSAILTVHTKYPHTETAILVRKLIIGPKYWGGGGMALVPKPYGFLCLWYTELRVDQWSLNGPFFVHLDTHYLHSIGLLILSVKFERRMDWNALLLLFTISSVESCTIFVTTVNIIRNRRL